MRRTTLATAAAMALVFLCGNAAAQLIQVSPGYVKAPLVRVYTNPDGSSYVRAPLVGIGSPPSYRRYGYYNGSDLAAMDWHDLAQAVRESASRLNVDLNRSSSGEFWKANLRTAEILKLVPADGSVPPGDDARGQLREILATYDHIGSDENLNGVASYNSFRSLHAALAEYVLPPVVHVGRQLRVAGSELHDALRQFSTGDTWRKYLFLEPNMALSARQRDEAAPLPDLATAKDALVRFDVIRDTPEYVAIADVPEFHAAREVLVSYVKLVAIPPPPEELPAPAKK